MATMEHVWRPHDDLGFSLQNGETDKSFGECWGQDRLIIASQLQNLLVVIRSDGRFGSKSHFMDVGRMSEHPVLRRLMELQREVMMPRLVRHIDEEAILRPFCDFCATDDMSDTIVGVVLTSLSNLVDLRCSFLTKDGLAKLLFFVQGSRDWVADNPSNEVVLARRLQVCVSCACHSSAHALPEHLFVGMVQHAYRLAVHAATSPLLRRTAEQAMKVIVSSLYKIVVERKPRQSLVHVNGSGRFDEATTLTGVHMLRYMCSLICGTEDDNESTKEVSRVDMRVSSKAAAVQLEGLWLVQAMLFVVKDQLCKPGWEDLLHGVQHDLCRALLVTGVRTANVIVLSQILRTVHIVTKIASVHVVPQMFSFIKALHLDPIMRITDDIQSALSSSRRTPMSPRSTLPPSLSTVSSFPMSVSEILDLCERRELLLESLVEFCTDADFITFCYTQYDLSRRFHPLLDRLSTVLIENCFFMANEEMAGYPRRGERDGFSRDFRIDDSLNRTDTLALEAISGLLGQTVLTLSLPVVPPPPGVTEFIEFQLEQRKLLMEFASLFRKDAAKDGIPFLLQKATRIPAGSQRHAAGGNGGCRVGTPALILEEPAGGKEVGICLFHLSDVLDKSALGEYLGELGREPPAPSAETGDEYLAARAEWEAEREKDHLRVGTVRFYEEQLKGFLQEFDYRNKSLLACIRETAYRMCMPGEAQKIDRVMEAFAKAWSNANRDTVKEINPFCSEHGPFILAFSLIMLNTDQHSGKLSKPMTQKDFQRVHRDSDGGNPLPEEYLKGLYDDVKAHPIIMAEMIDAGFTNDVTWALEMRELASPASLTGHDYGLTCSMQTLSVEKTEISTIQVLHKFAFRAVWNHCLTAFANALEGCRLLLESRAAGERRTNENDLDGDPPLSSADQAYNLALDGLCLLSKAATHFGVTSVVDHVVLVFLSQLRLDAHDAHDAQSLLVRLGNQRHSMRCLEKLFCVLNECTSKVVDSWVELGLFFAKLFLLGMLDVEPKTATSGTTELWEELRINPRVIVSGAKPAPSEGGWLSAIWGSSTSLDRLRAQEGEERKAIERVKAVLPPLSEFLKMIEGLEEKPYQQFFRSLCEAGKLRTKRTADGYAASYTMILITEVAVRRCRDTVVLDRYVKHCQQVFSHLFCISEWVNNAGGGGGGGNGNGGSQPLGGGSACKGEVHVEELGHSMGSEAYDIWLSATARVVGAALRAVKYFACNMLIHEIALKILDLVTDVPHNIFSVAVAPALSTGLFELITGDVVSPVWTHSLSVGILKALCFVVKTCEAPVVQHQARLSIAELLRQGQYDLLQDTEGLVNILVTCALESPGVDGEIAPASSVASGKVAQEEAMGGFANNLTVLCRHLVTNQKVENVHKEVLAWHRSWIASLRGLCSLVLLSRQYRDRSEALLCLQRCLLDSEIKWLPGSAIAVLYEDLIFPLTEQMCAPSSATLLEEKEAYVKRPNEISINSSLPQSLVTSIFSTLAPVPPGRFAAEAVTRQARTTKDRHLGALDLRCRVVGLLPKVLLHYLRSLRDTPEILQELWQRILGTLYALYTAPTEKMTSNGEEGRGAPAAIQGNNTSTAANATISEDEVSLREAIQEAVKNMVLVLTATLQEPDSLQTVAHVPYFWTSTKNLLRTFDFSEPLLAHIDGFDNGS